MKILHPFFFAVFPVLSLYRNNIDQTSFYSVYPTLIVLLIVLSVFILLINLFFKSFQKSATFASLIVFIFFTYGHIHTFLYKMAYNYQVSHHTFNLLSNLPKAELNFHIVLSIISMALIFLVIGG